MIKTPCSPALLKSGPEYSRVHSVRWARYPFSVSQVAEYLSGFRTEILKPDFTGSLANVDWEKNYTV